MQLNVKQLLEFKIVILRKLELVDLYNESTTLLSLGCRKQESLCTLLCTLQHKNPNYIWSVSVWLATSESNFVKKAVRIC